MVKDFDLLIQKLNAFIRKFYLNQLVKGVLLFFTALLILFLFIDFIEYFAWMGKKARWITFFSFLMIAFFFFLFYVVKPLLKLLKVGKTLTYEQAAKIVGDHFPEVKDKLLNLLQLHFKKASYSKDELDLLMASIDQKSRELTSVPVLKAIDLKQNIRYLKYFLPPFLLIVFLIVIVPSFIVEPTKRIVHYDEHFVKPLPYQIILLNDSMICPQHEDFIVKIKIDGDELPQSLFLVSGDAEYRMYQTGNNQFEYVFRDLIHSVNFSIKTPEVQTKIYTIQVLPKPVIYSFDVELKYPSYLRKKADRIQGTGHLVLPEGTDIVWRIYTKDVENVFFVLQDTVYRANKLNENTFKFKYSADHDFAYGIFASNQFLKGKDTLFYQVKVVPDQYPEISVNEANPDIFNRFINFKGQISDDYGFHSLRFFYKREHSDRWKFKNIKIDPHVRQQYFTFLLDFDSAQIRSGDNFHYFFEIRDNDVRHGFKASKTDVKPLHVESKEELLHYTDSTSQSLKNILENKMNELEKLNRYLEEFQKKLFEKQKLQWSDQVKLKELLEKEQEVKDKIDQIVKLNEEINRINKALKHESNDQLEEKQHKLEELFKQLEENKILEDLEKLKEELSKMDKDQLNQLLEEIKKENLSIKQNLEKNLSLYKQMEVEQKLRNVIQSIKELSEKEKKLADETLTKKLDNTELINKQDSLNRSFDNLMKDLEEIKKLDQSLEEPFNIEPDSTDKDSVKKEMEEAKKQLGNDKRKKAVNHQKNAAQQMKKISEEMESLLNSAMMQRAGEDMDKIKKLLDNVVDLSFKIESNIHFISSLNVKDPQYVTSTKALQNIKDEFTVVKDSLNAIGKRQIFIKNYIFKETETVLSNLKAAIKQLTDRKKGASLAKLQYSMTHLNNLALMLDESLENMKNSMGMSGSGQQSCPNPGKGESQSLEDILKQQKELAKKLGKEKNKQGQNNGKQKGKGEGEWGSPEELAKMAAMQYQIRMELQKLLEKLKSGGINDGGLSRVLKEMEKTEKDIINKNLTQETLKRQKDIEVRLLQSIKAEKERGKENKREAEQGVNRRRQQNSTQFIKIDKKNKENILILKPLELDYYFNQLYEKYIYQINAVK